jgi:hypothetical protein
LIRFDRIWQASATLSDLHPIVIRSKFRQKRKSGPADSDRFIPFFKLAFYTVVGLIGSDLAPQLNRSILIFKLGFNMVSGIDGSNRG